MQGDALLDLRGPPTPPAGSDERPIAAASGPHISPPGSSVVRRISDPQRSHSEPDGRNREALLPATRSEAQHGFSGEEESQPLVIIRNTSGTTAFQPTAVSASPSKSGAKTKKGNLSHIAHLNGLRALAFIGVLLFHFRHGCQGGFLGVDVFFVLSGYLMTRSIGSQLSSGSFSYKSFLIRRFWRLYPALLVTIMFALALTYAFFSTELAVQVARSAIASTLGISNLLFMSEEGYFGTSSALKPLLHTWSLSVEWQFYLLWPLMMAYAFRFAHLGRAVWPLSILSAVSFMYGISIASSTPQAAFFMLPGRAFEFGLGSLALTSVPTIKSQRLGNFLSLAGTSLVILSFNFINSTQGAPAVIALPALIGALMVIVSPSDAYANAVYTSSLFDYIGKISYSAYLVHWPVFVFYHNVYENTEAPWEVEAVIVTLMMLASAWMYHNVEDEFRSGKKTWHRFTGLGLVVAVLAISSHAIHTLGWPERSTATNIGATVRAYDHTYYLKEAKDIYGPSEKAVPGMKETYEYGIIPNSSKKSVSNGDAFDAVLVGDSFAGPMSGMLDAIAQEEGKSFVLSSHFSCAPFLDSVSTDTKVKDYPNPNSNPRAEKCKGHIRSGFLSLIKATKTKNVILIGNWLATSQMWRATYDSIQTNPHKPKNLSVSQLEETVVKLTNLGLKVVVVGMVPGAHYNVRACLTATGPLAFLKQCPPTSRFVEPFQGSAHAQRQMLNRVKIRDTMDALFKRDSPVLQSLVNEKRVVYVDPYKYMCSTSEQYCKVASSDGEPFYSDEYHLTPGGSKLLKSGVVEALKQLS